MKPLLLCIILITCTAAITSAQQTLFRETFPDGVAENEWAAGFNGDVLTPVEMQGNPSGDGWVGSLANHLSGGNVGQSYASGVSFTDFYYEAQVYISLEEGIYNGIEFRVDTLGLTAGYQFVAMFRQGGTITPRLRFRIRRTDNPGMPAALRDWEAAEIPGGIPTESGWHKMAVYVKAHSFTFYWDGQELPGGPIMDFTFLSGTIGAYVWDMSSPLIHLYIDDINVTNSVPVAVHDVSAPPDRPMLLQNYPQPFTGETRLRFTLPRPADARVEVYNVLGARVAVAADGHFESGTHGVAWDRAGLPDGVYLVRLVADGAIDQRSIVAHR
jgi:hypothetical protein